MAGTTLRPGRYGVQVLPGERDEAFTQWRMANREATRIRSVELGRAPKVFGTPRASIYELEVLRLVSWPNTFANAWPLVDGRTIADLSSTLTTAELDAGTEDDDGAPLGKLAAGLSSVGKALGLVAGAVIVAKVIEVVRSPQKG
jgi:hypothetical protein